MQVRQSSIHLITSGSTNHTRLPLFSVQQGMKVEDQSPCEGCQWCKSHRAPFPASSKCATKPLELVHTDKDGPMRTQAINSGYKYFIMFLDDYSSLGRAYYLHHKSESIQAFEDFKAWAENVTGNHPRTLRLRGGIYI